MAAGKFKHGHLPHPFPFPVVKRLVFKKFPLNPFGILTIPRTGRITIRHGVPTGQPTDGGGQKDDDAQENKAGKHRHSGLFSCASISSGMVTQGCLLTVQI